MSDLILGECVDQIGDTNVHPQTKRKNWGVHGTRVEGYGYDGDYSKYETDVLTSLNMKGAYPLWTPEEIRSERGGSMVSKKDGAATGFHLHNFFMSGEEVSLLYVEMILLSSFWFTHVSNVTNKGSIQIFDVWSPTRRSTDPIPPRYSR